MLVRAPLSARWQRRWSCRRPRSRCPTTTAITRAAARDGHAHHAGSAPVAAGPRAAQHTACPRSGGGVDDQPDRRHDDRSGVVLRPLDRVLGAAAVRAQHGGVRARPLAPARAAATGRSCCGSAAIRPTIRSGPPKPRKMPGWAFALTPAFLTRLEALVRRDRVRLIVDLNLVTDTPLTAATWARAAETSLPRGSIIGFEVGNEPDIYDRSYWVATIARSPLEARPLPLELTPDSYVDDFNALRARARRGGARRTADRAGGRTPRRQRGLDHDTDRRRAPRARSRERAPVSVLRVRKPGSRAIRRSRGCSAARPPPAWRRTSRRRWRSRTAPACAFG